ncbi:MAG: KOW motif-containing protein, partial [Candidatus Marinimicrobia bacterium]|nr:KOW motif-containing protein [Candidatus Neomarinimicrobiota bacterium]
MKIRKGDVVKVLTGAYRGKSGKVLLAMPDR